MNEDNKKKKKITKKNNKKKCRYFPKNFVHFGFFTNTMECERSKQDFTNKVIVLNARSVLIFQQKNARKRVSTNIIQLVVYFNYYKGKFIVIYNS